MNILLTGATGFIGRALCRRWRLEGHRLTVISRRPEQVAALLGAEVTAFKDVRALWQQHPDAAFDAIINLAGAPIAAQRWTPSYKRELIDGRVRMTQDIVWLCEQLIELPRVVISGSAMGFYGDQGAAAVTETTAPHDDFAHRLCQAWELAASPLAESGVRLITLRLGLVLGRSGGMLKSMLPAFRCGMGGWIGRGRAMMPWVLLDDVVRAITYMLTEPSLSGPVNMSAPVPVSQRDFMKAVGHALSRPVWVRVPTLAVWLALGERASLLTASVNMRPTKLLNSGFAFTAPQLPAALAKALHGA
ncbi:TIGR01777 family oxidoreductase [Zymobacter sp. IVIA_5232.4 C2]|uniref:TIGR01777 family oxidoreductase n=1 Tax=Zymobacter sp. IVIA_5232.4 C2 TaxID=3394855 RepID=UPI0039C4C477